MKNNEKYWAFVSYSSKDYKVAKWFHEKLENYPIPKNLKNLKIGDQKILGKYLRPIFIDRQELSSSYELGLELIEALKESYFLIVLCSKNSAKSQWVNKEIEDFKSLSNSHHKRILALIIDGEPNATTAKDIESNLECFPPALRYPLEPLAGDLRSTGDGKERGFLKIVAGITEINFSDLYDRHTLSNRRKIIRNYSLLLALSIFVTASILVILNHRKNLEQSNLVAKDKAEEARRASDLAEAEKKMRIDEVGRRGELLLEAAKNDYATARSKFSNNLEPDAFAYLARSLDYSKNSSHVARQVLAALNFWTTPPPLIWSNKSRFPVNKNQFSPDSNLLVTISNNGTGLVWDLSKGNIIRTLDEKEEKIEQALFSPNSNYIATSSETGSVSLWNSKNGKKTDFYFNHKEKITNISFSIDGNLLLSQTDSNNCIFDILENQVISNINTKDLPEDLFDSEEDLLVVPQSILDEIASHSPIKGKAVFDKNRSYVLTCHGEKVLLWNAVSRTKIREYNLNAWVSEIQFSPRGDEFIALCDDRVARIVEIKTGHTKLNLSGHKARIGRFLWSPDGKFVVTECFNRSLRIWNISKISLGTKFDRVSDVEFSPREKLLLIASADTNSCYLWDYNNRKANPYFGTHEGFITSASFSADGNTIVTASKDHKVSYWNRFTGENIGLTDFKTEVWHAEFTPDIKYLITKTTSGFLERDVLFWDLENSRLFGGLYNASSFSISSDNKTAAYIRGTESPGLIVDITESFYTFKDDERNENRAEMRQEFKLLKTLEDPESTLIDISISPDGKSAVTISQTGNVRLWESSSGKLLQVFAKEDGPDISEGGDRQKMGEAALNLISGSSGSVGFSNDGKYVISAIQGQVPKVFDIITGEVIFELWGTEDWINNAEISNDGTCIVTTSVVGQAFLWEIPTSDLNSPPSWFKDFIVFVAQKKIDTNGECEFISGDEFEDLRKHLLDVLKECKEDDTKYMQAMRLFLN